MTFDEWIKNERQELDSWLLNMNCRIAKQEDGLDILEEQVKEFNEALKELENINNEYK